MVTIDALREDLEIYARHTLILWGCGMWGERFVSFAQKTDLKITACCDNDSGKWGTEFFGIPVISPKELEEMQQDLTEGKKEGKEILVQLALAEVYETAVLSQFEGIGISNYMKTIRDFIPLAHFITRKFIETYPQVCKEVTDHININPSPTADFTVTSREGCVFVCQPVKTGDNTILETCRANHVPFLMLTHNSAYFRDNNNRIKITTAIRDPISIAISQIFHKLANGNICEKANIDFQDYFEFLEHRNVQKIFDKFYLQSRTARKPYLLSFFEEFSKNTVDVLQYPFDKEAGYTIIQEGNFDIFFYQLERLNDIVPALSQWMGVPFDTLVNGNMAEHKWIAKDYKQAQKDLRLTKEYFEDCYNDPYVRHCYSEADIEKFKARWEKNVDPNS